jgi:hypothetical protein
MTTSNSRSAWSGLLLALLGGTAAAPVVNAWDVTYDFTASGRNYTFTGNGAEWIEGDQETISGAVTFKVLRVAPPAGAITDHSTYAISNSGDWVEVEFTGETSAGPIAPSPNPGDLLRYDLQVANRYDPGASDYSAQAATKNYFDVSGSVDYGERSAGVNRFMYGGAPWFSGLNFDPRVSPQYNYLYANNYSRIGDDYTGRAGSFAIDSWRLASIDLRSLAESLAAVGPGRSLASKIRQAQAYYDADDLQSACLMLADFANQVRAQRGKSLTDQIADKLTADATAIITIVGCH